ncbi:MAG TPA: histidine ammonia-lyase [Cerasibacillus sp.]|uniref:histidine ammonia-lyase n=1 Tax=Cerasibacillus sp. TaxID=2498711 RepID=UPI002F3FEBFA
MIYLSEHGITLEEVKKIVLHGEKVTLSGEVKTRIHANRQIVEELIDKEQTMYGINTGFGKFSDVIIPSKDLTTLQLNLIRSHACGVGEPFSEHVSRAMVLLRAIALSKGYSGVRVRLVEQLLDYVNAGIHPVIPEQGSLGASGDLAPLSHLALTVIGEGEVFYKGKRMPTIEALAQAQLTPLRLEAKEGLALINGTQAMTAVGAIAFFEMEKLLYQSEQIAAMTFEGLRGIIDAFDEAVHVVRGHEEQIGVARRMRELLKDSLLITKQGEVRVQDAYSLRCIPQVLGASWQTVHYAKEKLQTEINAVTDNPLIFSEAEKVISGGNFHGQPIAFAMDFLKLGVAETANLSERRIERLVNPQLNNGLPPFLSPNPGLESGAMILQYTAASLVSENKTLAHPASVDSIPSSANQEDHVSMGTIAARHAYMMLQNTRMVIAIELICAMQAVEHYGVDQMASQTRELYKQAREVVPSIERDRIFHTDIEKLTTWLKEN